MGWVPDDMWFTYLRLGAPAGALNYDLAVATRAGAVPSAVATGFGLPGGPVALQSDIASSNGEFAWWWPVAGLLAALILFVVVGSARERRTADAGNTTHHEAHGHVGSRQRSRLA